MKKILSLLTACSLVFSITATTYAAVPDDIYEDEDCAGDIVLCESEDTAEAEDVAAPESVPVSDMSMDEVLGIVEEAARKADACEEYIGGVCGVELTEEEAEAIRIAVDCDKENSDSDLLTDWAYYYSSADIKHGYYYRQLNDKQKEIYDALGAACEEYLYSDRDTLTSNGFVEELYFNDINMKQVQLQQCYWTFFYSNPQYFFLPSTYSYGYSETGNYGIIALRSHPECRPATDRHSMNDQIKSTTDEWMDEINKCATDVEKEMMMAKLIADNTDYRGERDTEGRLYQTIMAVFIRKKAVCTSYAKTLVYLCGLANIEAIVVTSKKSEEEAHAWTRVKLGNKWYESDPTWYDQTDGSIGYWDQWMNKSTATITSEDELHDINYDFELYYGITLPECNEDYQGGDPGPGPDPVSGKCGDDAVWEYDEGVLTIRGSGDMYDFAADEIPWAIYKDSVAEVRISGVSSIGDNAFSGYTGLRKVTLPEGLTGIGTDAFRGCAGITALSLPASLSPNNIGADAFTGCSGLSHIHIPHWSIPADYTGKGGLPDEEDYYHVLSESGYCDDKNCPFGMFGYESGKGVCGDTLEWEYDSGVLTITGSGDMYDYSSDSAPWSGYADNITKLILPEGLTYIGQYAFEDLEYVTVLDIPASLSPGSIGRGAFTGCTGLAHIHIPNGGGKYAGAGGLPADTSIYHELSADGKCDDKNCPSGLFDYSRVGVSFGVKGVFGGREVTFSCEYPDAQIYFAASTSALTTAHPNVLSGEKILFKDFYGTIYARTYINGIWGVPCRLILKIPVVKDPVIRLNGATAVISTQTPDSYIIYTTDGTEPSTENGKRIYGQASVDISSVAVLKAIAVRSCFTNSKTVEKTFDFKVAPPSFEVKGVFGGRNVTFRSETPGAKIYYTTENRSVLNLRDSCADNGETVLFEKYYGTVYARAYINGKWSNVSRLILKIPQVSAPKIVQNGNTLTISSSTPSAYIIYTLDGTKPSADNGTKAKAPAQIGLRKGMKIRVLAARSGFSNSDELIISVN